MLSLFVGVSAMAESHVKKINVAVDELTVIHTAVGIATIIQCPEAVSSVIIGDQGAFKIEYLDRAITIKPLRFGAKTNLYVSTLTRRYNVRLASVAQDLADYVVYLSPRESLQREAVKWREFQRSVSHSGLTFDLKRSGKTKDGFILLEFILKSTESTKINPDWFFLAQGNEPKVIHSLFLSSTDVSEKSPLTVVMSLNRSDLISEAPAMIEIKSNTHKLSIELSREVLWRR
jgi:hypothetical protein